MRRPICGISRPGHIAPLAAVLLIPLLAFIGFSVDVGYLTLTQGELQNAADAAALAAVDKLRDPFAKWSIYGVTSGQQASVLSQAQTDARTVAGTIAAANFAAARSVVVDTSNDVKFGYLDSADNYDPNPPASTFPNTVEITVRYDGGSATNPPLKLFFAPVLGLNSATLTATARATMYQGTAANVDTSTGLNGNLLPVAVKQADWNNFFMNGFGAEVTTAPNGLPQFQVYPGGGGQPGSFGLLSLAGGKATSQPTYSNWILNGPTVADLTNMQSAQNLPLNGSQTNWYAGPGYKASLLPDFAARMDQPLVLPLFDTAGGTGSNAYYHIVAFVGIRITNASGNISVQPSGVSDPTLIVSNPVPAGTSSSNSFIFAPSRLTY